MKRFPDKLPKDLVADFYKQPKIHIDRVVEAKKTRIQNIQNYSLAPYSGTFGLAERKHILNRTVVGLCKRHLQDLEGLDLDQAIEHILTPELLGEPTNNYYHDMDGAAYAAQYNNEDVAPGAPFIHRPYVRNNPGSEEQFGWERYSAIISWVNNSIYEQQTSVHWKLFIFLHNLVPTRCFDTIGHKGGYLYIKLLFDACFGSYKQFIYDVTLDPSMLVYLNLALSQKDTPDENYAREVQELFTVGKRPFAQFSESDVREIARALVGWTYDYESLVYGEGTERHTVFNEWNHDSRDKHFSEFYNNRTITGRSGPEGADELTDVIDMLFETDESAIYICRRLYQFFVYPVLNDQIESQIIAPLATIFKQNNHSMIAVLRVLLKSAHFFDASITNSLIKSPLDFNFSILKELKIPEGNLEYWDGSTSHKQHYNPGHPAFQVKNYTSDTLAYDIFAKHLNWVTHNQGMQLFSPPNVSGWPAYYQEPVYDLFWINTSTIKARKNMSFWVRWGMWCYSYEDRGVNLKYDLHRYLSGFEQPDDLNAFLDEFIERMHAAPMRAELKSQWINELLGGLPMTHWTEYVRQFLDNPTQENENQMQWRLDNVFFKFFELSEFHIH